MNQQEFFVETVTAFESQFQEYQKSGNMLAFCQMIQLLSESDEDKELWGIIETLFQPNIDTRRLLLHHLLG